MSRYCDHSSRLASCSAVSWKSPRARSLAMSMSKPMIWPFSSSKCQGGLVAPVPTISLPRPRTCSSRLWPASCASVGCGASPAAATAAPESAAPPLSNLRRFVNVVFARLTAHVSFPTGSTTPKRSRTSFRERMPRHRVGPAGYRRLENFAGLWMMARWKVALVKRAPGFRSRSRRPSFSIGVTSANAPFPRPSMVARNSHRSANSRHAGRRQERGGRETP